jgi:hypothetical protein
VREDAADPTDPADPADPTDPCPHPLAVGESVIKCPSPLNVPKDTYDHSCY